MPGHRLDYTGDRVKRKNAIYEELDTHLKYTVIQLLQKQQKLAGIYEQSSSCISVTSIHLQFYFPAQHGNFFFF